MTSPSANKKCSAPICAKNGSGVAYSNTANNKTMNSNSANSNSANDNSINKHSVKNNSAKNDSADNNSMNNGSINVSVVNNQSKSSASKTVSSASNKTKQNSRLNRLDSFYKNKRVFVTGHTGFKGGWLVALLDSLGAEVCGYALPPASPSVYELLGGDKLCRSVVGDIRDLASLKRAFDEFSPEIVLHLAAQPIVLESYKNPVATFETNVMGTVNILECVRLNPCVKSFLNITTDKVYKNNECTRGYRETDELCGLDPYSNSKSCSEFVTHSYKKSFLAGAVAASTARAGNVIGGGDFAADRIVPDCVRSALSGSDIFVRNPNSVRPYQHVLEPLFAYLRICMEQYSDMSLEDCYNVGPDESDCAPTGRLVDIFCKAWGGIKWTNGENKNAPHEASFLQLDCSKIKHRLGIVPVWNLEKAIEMTVLWTRAYSRKANLLDETRLQIESFRKDAGI